MAALLTTIDLKRLAAEVSVQHGIRIDADDPMMAVVTLNRLVLEEAIAQVLERVQAAVREFDSAADKVQVRAGGVLAQEVRDAGVAMRQEFARAFEELCREGTGDRLRTADVRWRVVWIWITGGFAVALVGFALGVWFGTMPG
jgi:hypothetical protein